MEEKVQQYIRALRKSGTPVNARVVIAVAEGIVTETDHTLLLKNSRHIKLSLDWAYSLLKKMGYVKRKATTDKDSKKNLLLQKQIKKAVKNGKIPPELVIKCDQTGVNVCHLPSGRKQSKGVQELRLQEMEISSKLLTLWQAHSVANFYHSRFCGAVDKPESDAESEDDPFADIV